MSLYKVGATWYVSLSHDGRRIRRSTGTDDRRQAQEYHDRLKADLWRSDRLGERAKIVHTWGDAATLWMAAETRSQSDAYRLRWISARWRGVALDSIDADAVAELIDERDGATANGLAPATVNRWLAQIVAILNVALRRVWIDKLPVLDHKTPPPGRTNWLTGEQWIAVRDALPQHLRQMARFAIATGLRRHNVTHLQWDQIDLERRVAWVHPDQTKAGNAIGCR